MYEDAAVRWAAAFPRRDFFTKRNDSGLECVTQQTQNQSVRGPQWCQCSGAIAEIASWPGLHVYCAAQ